MELTKLQEQSIRVESFKEGYLAALKWVAENVEKENKEKEEIAVADHKDAPAK